MCGKCVAELTWAASYDGVCDFEVGTFYWSECSDTCIGAEHRPRPDFRAECEAACRASDYCVGGAPTCVADCAAVTTGLETLCGKCVAHNLYLEPPVDDGACSVELASPEWSECSDVCTPGTHTARTDFRAECDVACRGAVANSNCAVPPTCVEDCTTVAQGLETQCGKCVAAQTYIDEVDGQCALELGSAEWYECESACR